MVITWGSISLSFIKHLAVNWLISFCFFHSHHHHHLISYTNPNSQKISLVLFLQYRNWFTKSHKIYAFYYCVAMWFGIYERKRDQNFLYFSMVMFLVTTLVCCHSCHVGALRIFPGKTVAKVEFSREVLHNNKINNSNKNKDLFNKFFKGSTFFDKNKPKMEFDDIKRRVPSCPDPLHN